MFDDISSLVSETFDQVERGMFAEKLLAADSFDQPDELAGVIFHLEKKVSTFVIRVESTDNLRDTYHKIVKDPSSYPKLRLDTEVDLRDQLDWFVCDSVMHEELIKHGLANKRFPLYDEAMMNISDPGDSWWFKSNNDSFSIHFQLSHMNNSDDFIKLGPLGDCSQVMENFRKLRGYFSILFPVSTYSSGHGQVVMGTSSPDNVVFQGIKDLFISGETGHMFWEHLRNLEEKAQLNDENFLRSLQKANFFLVELATIRRFWIAIEEKL